MKRFDLNILLQEGEGSMLEYKESLSASFAREVVALANTSGGKILLGVRDDGTIKGIPDSNELRARIQDIARNCDPPVKVLVQRVDEVTVVTVRESEAKPVQCSDGFFWRQGAVTQKLSRDEICDFFRSEGGIRFDLSPCPKFRYPRDFDREKYDAWFQLSGITGRPRTEDVLVNIDAAERAGGGLVFRNAGVLFFARNVRHFFNQAYITCLLAKGADKVHILDRKDFTGGIVSDIEDSLRFIERNTRMAYRIEGLRREDVPEYPMKALREAITNAVMHRDWFMEGANVFVEIYTDRVEISSPGGLPKGMKLSDLGRKSIRRNALIADLLHRITFIEKAGTGIKRMRDEAHDQHCPAPIFEDNGFFTAIFYPNPEVRAQADARQGPSTAQVPPKYPASATEVTTEVTRPESRLGSRLESRLGSRLESRLESAMAVKIVLILKNGEQGKAGLATELGHKTVSGELNKQVKRLQALGLIEMTMPEKPNSRLQKYRLTNKGHSLLESGGNHV
jgi:ATP-dependent DNA helicase RecG